MRNFFQSCYSFLMRAQGIYGIILVIYLGTNLLNAVEQAISIAIPIVYGLISLAAAITITFPKMTPNWLARPDKLLHLFPVLILTGLFQLLFAFLGMAAVILAGIEEPLSRQISIGTALPSVFLSGLMWWIGLALCVWPNKATAQKPPKTPPTQPTPVAPRDITEDLRALRLSRMGSNA